jgi:hypothetical protein
MKVVNVSKNGYTHVRNEHEIVNEGCMFYVHPLGMVDFFLISVSKTYTLDECHTGPTWSPSFGLYRKTIRNHTVKGECKILTLRGEQEN